MKKANSTRVLGVHIKIEHVPNLIETEGNLGEADDDTFTIRLDASLEGDRYKRVLRHERTHMALRMSGIVEHLDDNTEEALCRLMETFRP